MTEMATVVAAAYYWLTHLRKKKRKKNYITKESLLPVNQSSWRRLLATGDESAWLSHMFVHKALFRFLQAHFDIELRVDLARSSMTASDILGLTLKWLTSADRQKSMQIMFAQSPAVINRALYFGLDALQRILLNEPLARIRWPKAEEFAQFSELIKSKWRLLHCEAFVI
jgi:hypothetical protein